MERRYLKSFHRKSLLLMAMASGLTFAPIDVFAEQNTMIMQQSGNVKGRVTEKPLKKSIKNSSEAAYITCLYC